ncbi:hypothetical protein CEUSTIGMA_g7815.t1 [Chlamydomonas eustigma]|uniref:Glycosyl hydrolase family 32 N-terminal domain-containing protein n=1 Tax=Chlamydomonas eustigma TaxID=1157962 RepID=A0A250XBE1_9CHLO|nr:hypothetical protein CEUSTIGMA_g7815.t1 [Chlamydomonas eustigma]|eukprot:GAX80376.1 hypothetical protein CEUSTIGMA_g7815.t1 [Chlamydomonas eustigma]
MLVCQLRKAACRHTTDRKNSLVTVRAVCSNQPATTEGLIFRRGTPGSWDEAGVGSPVVRCYFGDDEERWVMWYAGRSKEAPSLDMIAPSSGSTGIAISKDGIHWVRGEGHISGEKGASAASDVGMVMEPNKDWWCFDTCHMQVSDVQIMSNSSVESGVGVFWMFYSGGDFQPISIPSNLPSSPDHVQPPGHKDSSHSADQTERASPSQPVRTVEGLRMRPGLAMSQDGRNWARIEAEHHTGALFDVGSNGEWDELFIGTPQVLAVGPKDMRMFYHSWDQQRGRYVIGLATSPDGFRWTKKGVVFDPHPTSSGEVAGSSRSHDELGAASCHVTRDIDNRQYVMFYEAVAADNTRSIGLAISKDGLKDWQRCPTPLLTSSSDEVEATASGLLRWDCGSVGQPCAVSMSQGQWRLYYAGRSSTGKPGANEGIGLALSVEGSAKFLGMPTQFKRRNTALSD